MSLVDIILKGILLIIFIFTFTYFKKKIKKYSRILKVDGLDGIYFYFINKNYKNKGIWNFIDKKKILIDIIDTGKNTGTGGRIKKAFNKLSLNEDFLATYGDGLSNVPIKKLIKYHYDNKATLTLTAVRPKQRYGILKISKGKVNYFDNSKKLFY